MISEYGLTKDKKEGIFYFEIKTKKNKMTNKQINKFANFLVKKTNGQFHYEDNNWFCFFNKDQLKKVNQKLLTCMNKKNYQYFCNCLFNAFDNLYKKKGG